MTDIVHFLGGYTYSTDYRTYYDNFIIPYIPPTSTSKGGLIPEDSGDHFFVNTSLTNNHNPNNCTLNAGEYCIMNWTIFANGSIDNFTKNNLL